MLAPLLVCAALVAGCGTSKDDPGSDDASLTLDFTPNAVHGGLYLGLSRHYFAASGVRMVVNIPSSSTDATKLLAAGKTTFAIMDIHDLALADAKGADLVGVAAIVERPLASVLARADVRTPKDLDGKDVGVTGAPSDDAVLDSVVKGAGGNPDSLKRKTIGFNAVPAVVGGKVAGATAFWNVEGIALREKDPKAKVFRVDQYGAPRYPELVLVTTSDEIKSHASLVRRSVYALQRGERAALVSPAEAVKSLMLADPSANEALTRKQLDAIRPAYRAPDKTIATLDMTVLRKWASWEARFGITKSPPDVTKLFDPSFAQAGAARMKATLR
jgi:putative hydroxymethylpyrimidine transport system substrate-binding protein